MEHPMITIIGSMDSQESLDNAIRARGGTQLVLRDLGSNERDHAWMDEGVNSFIELRYMRERYPASGFSIGIPGLKKLTKALSIRIARKANSVTVSTHVETYEALSLTSDDFTEPNYGTDVYMKTAFIFIISLLAYLGEEMMDRCMHAYFEEWKFKHPQPEDMRKVFERGEWEKPEAGLRPNVDDR